MGRQFQISLTTMQRRQPRICTSRLHSANPDETGTQATNEINVPLWYNTYARVAVARTTGLTGWTVSNIGGVGTVNPGDNITFPACICGTGVTATHFGVGTSPTVGAAGYLLYKGTVTPNIPISTGVTPRLTVATKIEED